ncbi:ABC transporter permease [Candidatus Sumerlaeota bacterium]|nr:ABC transporter permease [Candidatus Sumerlaeota bacterium]
MNRILLVASKSSRLWRDDEDGFIFHWNVFMFREMWKSRELVWNLVKRDLKTRYKSSALGFFWSFGKPLFLMLILWFVFTTVLRLPQFNERNPKMPFTLHLLTGILVWSFFTGGLMDAMHSIYANSNLVKKVKLDAAVFPISSVLANLVNHLLALLVLFCFMIGFKAPFGGYIFLLPVVILLQTFFMITLSLFLSSLYIFYRDVGSIVEILLTGWFYATPIIYPFWLAEEAIPEKLGQTVYYLYLLNPITPIVVAYRRLLFHSLLNPPEMPDARLLYYLLYAFLLSGFFYILFRRLFRHYALRFADEL